MFTVQGECALKTPATHAKATTIPSNTSSGKGANEMLAGALLVVLALAIAALVVPAHAPSVGSSVAAVARAPASRWGVDLVVEPASPRTGTVIAPLLANRVAKSADRSTRAGRRLARAGAGERGGCSDPSNRPRRHRSKDRCGAPGNCGSAIDPSRQSLPSAKNYRHRRASRRSPLETTGRASGTSASRPDATSRSRNIVGSLQSPFARTRPPPTTKANGVTRTR